MDCHVLQTVCILVGSQSADLVQMVGDRVLNVARQPAFVPVQIGYYCFSTMHPTIAGTRSRQLFY